MGVLPGPGSDGERTASALADRSITRPFGPAALAGVAAAYYVGAVVGFVLRFPPATTSVLWPPNAILTAAVLLAPPRRAGLVVLAALPAHVLVQMQWGLPLPLIAVLYATNSLEALLAAWLVRRWSDEPTRFDSLPRVLAFLAGAVLLAPFATTFGDAAAVYALRGEPLGSVLIRRFLSNVLSQLVIVPSAIMLVRGAVRGLRDTPPRRRWEVAFLAAGQLAAGAAVFSAYHGSFKLPGGPFAALPLLLPVLLFAAVRYGPAGASFSLLASALLATGNAVWRAEGAALLLAEERVLALQVFLIVVGAPLLALSALVEERRQAAAALWERLRFEALVSQISGAFVHVPSHEMQRTLGEALGRLGTFLHVDRIILWNGAGGDQPLRPAAGWSRPGTPPADPEWEAMSPGRAALLLAHEPVVWMDRAELPPGDTARRDLAEHLGARALLALPLAAGDRVVGSLGLVCVSEGRAWPPSEVAGLRLVADVFAGALARRRAEDALRASESMNSAVLSSLVSRVAVLDRAGRIVAVNDAWARFVCENAPHDSAGVGESYLDICRRVREPRAQDALETAAGIEAVLSGRAPTFGGDYARATPLGDRWFHLMVVPLNREEGGVVLSYTDITERRQAETQASHVRDELAHCLRLSTVGALTTSIAHELNQPLAAILANAHAARRLLAGPAGPARQGEVDEILEDIISEDRRAGDVIRGVRQMVRRSEPELEEMDVNGQVGEVLRMVANDVLIREVTLLQDLFQDRVLVRGDRVQLQQVLLNLLVNALDAVAGSAGDRVISVRTERRPDGMATVSVGDTGPGLPPGTEADVFEPFYTTKTKCMGMGLSIARSIVEAHGGTITAEAAASGGGATFTVALPLSSAARAGGGVPSPGP